MHPDILLQPEVQIDSACSKPQESHINEHHLIVLNSDKLTQYWLDEFYKLNINKLASEAKNFMRMDIYSRVENSQLLASAAPQVCE